MADDIPIEKGAYENDTEEEKLEKLKKIQQNIIELAREKEIYENELQKLRQAKKLKNDADNISTHFRHIGAGYYVSVEKNEFSEELSEDIKHIRKRVERTEKVIKILQDEGKNIIESLN